MEVDPLPDDVQNFIREHIASVSQLEVMLLLRASHPRAWTAVEVATTLFASVEATADQLNRLVEQGLVERAEEVEAYRFAPQTPDLERLAGHLAGLYKDRRVAVVSVIYSETSE